MKNKPSLQDSILVELKNCKEGYLSGEDLSRKFSVTRTAIWKHVHELIELGYNIESLRNAGYKLVSVPDNILPAELKERLQTALIGRKLFCFNVLGSTNEMALKLAEGGEGEGGLIIAESQTAGKGRLSRKWVSPFGLGLWFSVILRPRISPIDSAKLTFIAGLAVLEAVKKLTGLTAGLKWPNDVYLNGKKICGILTDMKADMDEVKYLILGIGVNVNLSAQDFADGLSEKATSIAVEYGKKVNRIDLLAEILCNLEKNYSVFKKEGFAPFHSGWKSNSVTLNKRVRVSGLNCAFEGLAVDIDENCALVLKQDSGDLKKVYSGDVS